MAERITIPEPPKKKSIWGTVLSGMGLVAGAVAAPFTAGGSLAVALPLLGASVGLGAAAQGVSAAGVKQNKKIKPVEGDSGDLPPVDTPPILSSPPPGISLKGTTNMLDTPMEKPAPGYKLSGVKNIGGADMAPVDVKKPLTLATPAGDAAKAGASLGSKMLAGANAVQTGLSVAGGVMDMAGAFKSDPKPAPQPIGNPLELAMMENPAQQLLRVKDSLTVANNLPVDQRKQVMPLLTRIDEELKRRLG